MQVKTVNTDSEIGFGRAGDQRASRAKARDLQVESEVGPASASRDLPGQIISNGDFQCPDLTTGARRPVPVPGGHARCSVPCWQSRAGPGE